MTLHQKIGKLFMIGFYGTELPPDVRDLILSYEIGFVILFSRNIESFSQVRALTDTIHGLGDRPPLIFVDQEGGGIVRFGELAATAISAMGLTATQRPENAQLAGQLLATDMKACGIDGIFAPVLDVNVAGDNPVIGIRSYSDDPEIVIDYATRFMQGVQACGLLTCGKHFPGHGAATADSHLEIPEISLSWPYFRKYCLSPFQALIARGIDSLMTCHVRFPEQAPDISTFSRHLLGQLLRDELQYDRVLFSDCLEMNAVQHAFTPEEVVRLGIQAGLDVFSVSHRLQLQQQMLESLEHLITQGIITESRIDQSVRRIQELRQRYWERNATPLAAALTLRPDIATERQLARSSITLLQNEHALIPLRHDRKTLIIEWQKTIVGPSIQENDTRSMVARLAPEFFEHVEVVTIKPNEEEFLSRALVERLHSGKDEYVLLCIYSRSGEVGQRQKQMVEEVLKYRNDGIIISLENPYEIKKYPTAATFLVTYGFRFVQVEALFQLLVGAIPAQGKLPVHL